MTDDNQLTPEYWVNRINDAFHKEPVKMDNSATRDELAEQPKPKTEFVFEATMVLDGSYELTGNEDQVAFIYGGFKEVLYSRGIYLSDLIKARLV